MEKREGYKIFVTSPEKERLDAMLDELGIKQKDALTRLVRHFLASDPVLQLAMLGLMPDQYGRELAALMVLRIAGEDVPVRAAVRDAAAASLIRLGIFEAAQRIAVEQVQPQQKSSQASPQRRAGSK